MQGDHYFSAAPQTDSKPAMVTMKLGALEFELETDRGVFSPSRLDPGTKVLLKEIPDPPPSGVLLDLGCGYGPIAAYLAARSPKAQVYAVDVNERAVELTRRNAERLALGNLITATPGQIDDQVTFNAIYSNPPIRIGKEPLHQLLAQWLQRLAPNGTAYFVVQKHLGSDSLGNWLSSQGYDVARLASKRAYRVLKIGGRQ